MFDSLRVRISSSSGRKCATGIGHWQWRWHFIIQNEMISFHTTVSVQSIKYSRVNQHHLQTAPPGAAFWEISNKNVHFSPLYVQNVFTKSRTLQYGTWTPGCCSLKVRGPG